jgi:hypothetical protein
MEHALEPSKTASGIKTYVAQPYDSTWEQLW